jgi:hypothetical protein
VVFALVATLLAAPAVRARDVHSVPQDAALKAAFIFNFAKFTEWPVLPPATPIAVCITGDDAVAAALVDTVRGQNINGHPLEVRRPQGSGSWRACHLLFVADADRGRATSDLAGIKTLPVLTVSDIKGFAQSGGIIELYVEDGRMRFAINVTALERSGLRLRSRLIGLARTVRGVHDP